ncbi:penicillin acylase family protein [Undibacterium sp. Jales W-56]|uniref:penicillin acylase family protein n=1 Tax=Undibacterium sp. Jales W-56 TaxID=2897325 RepID=UPI0021D1B25E|nr:penicillin acylase family protein [Undibacterium sp. Jales W-56]MCU6434191.1 penicillin acylase family protein [Undibacterium sp. Jales W-56]
MAQGVIDDDLDAMSSRNYQADIRRTSLGVPHIKAANWGDLGYGYGYAQAEDNLCTMADAFLTYRGERSRYLGADALPVAASTLEPARNLDSDFFHKQVISSDALSRMVAAQTQELRSLVRGFAAGYNRYLRTLRASSNTAHSACRYADWVQPIRPADVYRRMYAANLAGGYSNFVNGIASAVPPDAASKTVAALPFDPAQTSAPQMQVGGSQGIGSNMIAYGSAATTTASPLLFGNPHWYWRGGDRFYQAQLTIPGQLNVSGASFLGVPVILIGFNENVAWTHTVSTARRFGIVELTLANGDTTSYVKDGKKVRMTANTIAVSVRQADGRLGVAKRTLYRSEYGPLLNLGLLNPALSWNTATAFAIRDINATNYHSFRNWMRWNQAQSLDEFIRIQKEELATPWVNTAAIGRASGQAWYADMGAVPNVTNAQAASCTTPTGQALAAYLPRVPFLDGARSACDWSTDSDSAQRGAFGVARLPSLLRSDYVANMNDSYWSSNPKALLTGFADIIGSAGTEALSMRTRLGHSMAQGRLDGTDGYAGTKASVDIVKQMVLNSRVLTAELFKTQVLPLICASASVTITGDPETGVSLPATSVNLSSACAALAVWDNSGNPNARGAHVWDEFWRRASLLPATQLYQVQFNPADPLHTPRDINPANALTLQQALGAAVLRVQNSGYTMNALRGDTLFVTRHQRKIGLFGGCENAGYFTVACSENRLDQGGYSMDGNPNGNSYMQIVSFTGSGVEAHTFLTFSLSDDAASIRSGNYTDRYAAKNWLKLPFIESEIRNDAAYSNTTIREW